MEEEQKYDMDQELSQREGEEYHQLSPSDDVQSHLHMYPCEGDEREPELSQVGDNSKEEVGQGKYYNLQKLAQWEKDSSDQQLSQREESVSSQEPSQWDQTVMYKIDDSPMHPEEDEDAQTCAQQKPGSPSSVGTQVAGEAAPELPSTSPAPGSPTEDELTAAAAGAGAAEEMEEPPEPLVAEVGKTPGSPAGSEEVPWAGTERPVPAPRGPPACCQALLCLEGHLSSEEVLQAVLEIQQPEEQGALEQSTAAELEASAAVGREESPTSAPHSPCCPPSPSPSPPGAQELSEQQEEADRASVWAEEESEEGALAEDLEHSQCQDEEHTDLTQADINKHQEGSQGEACIGQEISPAETSSNQEGSQGEACIGQEISPEEADLYNMLSDWDEYTEEELSNEDIESYQEISDWEVSPEQALSQPLIGISQSLSDWDEYSEHELSHGDFSSFQEVSDWEQSIGQGLCNNKDTIAQKVSGENARRPSVPSAWESNSAQDLVQHGWEENIGHKALLHEEGEWDEISVLELPEDPDRERRLAELEGGWFLVPVPHEAWVEDGASEPCPWGLLCASPPHVEPLASFQEQEPEADTPSQQRGPRKKHLSRLRRALRALRGLFRFSCRAPQPQE